MRVNAALSERAVVVKVPPHLDLPTALPPAAPARAPPWSEDELDQGDLEHDLEWGEWGDDAELECTDTIG